MWSSILPFVDSIFAAAPDVAIQRCLAWRSSNVGRRGHANPVPVNRLRNKYDGGQSGQQHDHSGNIECGGKTAGRPDDVSVEVHFNHTQFPSLHQISGESGQKEVTEICGASLREDEA
jgi:hypothetical protein